MPAVALLFPLLFLSSAYATSCGHSQLSDADKNDLLKVHNDLRASIAKGEFVAKTDRKPPAVDMQMLQWDCELEKGAQSWADKCPEGHSTFEQRGGTGENLYWSFSSKPTTPAGIGKDAATNWAKEFQDFGWPNRKMDPEMFASGIGHATQMAWAKTNKLGCGVKACPSTKYPDFPHSIFVVCRYNPPGNYMNQDIYTAAPTCKDVRSTSPGRRS